jgi:GntR family transcriptional regulator
MLCSGWNVSEFGSGFDHRRAEHQRQRRRCHRRPGGNTAQLHSLGIVITRIVENVRARIPLADEVAILRMPAGVPVLTITRRTFADDRVVEVAVDITLPADRNELRYEISLQ